jgi:hypothetical protein
MTSLTTGIPVIATAIHRGGLRLVGWLDDW